MSESPIRLQRARERFRTATDWVTSYSSFSYGTHYDPDNVGFGALLVNNHEVVQPGPGYDRHPHANAEILTWVLGGALVHEDSAGHRGVVGRGTVQRMSAGSGIVHAERNDAFRLDPDQAPEPVEFVQMWLRPDAPDTPPDYRVRDVDLADLDTGWVPVVSGQHPDAALDLGTAGATLWVTRLAPGVRRTLPAGPRSHCYLAAGSVELAGVGLLDAGDAVRLTDGAAPDVTGVAEAELLVWELR